MEKDNIIKAIMYLANAVASNKTITWPLDKEDIEAEVDKILK